VPLIQVYLWRWLIGAVAKAMTGAQNMMLALAGPQSIGKSLFARWLCPLPEYFLEAPINVNDKDTYVRLISRFIWEVSELDATTRKADVAALKAFITEEQVTVRKAYGRHDTVRPALASLIGTVNQSTGFLSDDTGNRRFLVATIEAIDWSYTQLDIHQIWAEAVAAYKRGEPHRLTTEERAAQDQQNKLHETESVIEDWITRHFVIGVQAGAARMTGGDIIDHLRDRYGIRLNGSERSQAMEISRVLVRLGVQKIRTNAWRGYEGILPK
jgi:predicted P-loop ATPase